MVLPIAALMYRLKTPAESELSFVASIPSITLSGQHLHESKMAFGRKILKNMYVPTFYG